MFNDYKASNVRILRNILLIILCITFFIGVWRILIDTTAKEIPEAQKIFKEEKNLEK